MRHVDRAAAGRAGRRRHRLVRPGVTGAGRVAILLAAALSVVGCGVSGALVATLAPPDIVSGTPLAAGLHVTGDPEVASDGVTLRMAAFGESDPVVVLEVGPGERIIAQAASMPGEYVLTDAAGGCSVPVTLVGGRETDVVLTLAPGVPCRLTVAGEHLAGEIPHPWFGAASITLGGPPVPSSALEVRSLDTPPNPVPSTARAEPDRPGHYYVTGLPQGRYEAAITADGATIGSATFEIGVGAEAEVPVLVEPQATP